MLGAHFPPSGSHFSPFIRATPSQYGDNPLKTQSTFKVQEKLRGGVVVVVCVRVCVCVSVCVRGSVEMLQSHTRYF